MVCSCEQRQGVLGNSHNVCNRHAYHRLDHHRMHGASAIFHGSPILLLLSMGSLVFVRADLELGPEGRTRAVDRGTMLEDFATPSSSGRLGGGIRPGEVLRSGQQRLNTRGWGTDYPLQAPGKIRLFNARQGDPRRQVGHLLSDEDLRHKKQVDQDVWGKKSYLWRDIDTFDPFREGEIRALRRGEIVGFMDERPNSCELEVTNPFPIMNNEAGVTCNNDEECIILQACENNGDCPVEQNCVPYCEGRDPLGGCRTGWAKNFTDDKSRDWQARKVTEPLMVLLHIENNSRTHLRCKEKCGTKDAVFIPSFNPVWSSTDDVYMDHEKGTFDNQKVRYDFYSRYVAGGYINPATGEREELVLDPEESSRPKGQDTKVCSGRRLRACETKESMRERYGSKAQLLDVGMCRPVYCMTGHDTNLYTRYNERADSDKSKYNNTYSSYDDLDQVAGNLELPGAGVDYHRDDIIRQIRYAELLSTKVDPNTGQRLFELVINKCDATEQQLRPFGHPACEVQTEHIPTPGEQKPLRKDIVLENVEAHRVFQLWAPPHQASMQADENGRIKFFDAHEDTVVVHCDTVEQLLHTQNMSDHRLHILLRAGTEYVLHRPLNFTSTRVHISGYQNYTKLIMPVSAAASTAYSSYTMPDNLVSGSGLLTRQQLCNDDCIPNIHSPLYEQYKDGATRRLLLNASIGEEEWATLSAKRKLVELSELNRLSSGRWPQDGVCDDGGVGAYYDMCELGTDCSDCGPRFVPRTSAPPQERGVTKDDVGMNKGLEGELDFGEGGGGSSREVERAMGHGMVERHDGHDQTRTHDNQFSAGTMWQSAWGTVKNQWVSFDLGPNLQPTGAFDTDGRAILGDRGFELISAFVWNFNQDRVARPRSVRTLYILSSPPTGGRAVGPMGGGFSPPHGSANPGKGGVHVHMGFGDLAPGTGYSGRVRIAGDPDKAREGGTYYATDGEYIGTGYRRSDGTTVRRLSTDMILPTCESIDPQECPDACTEAGMEACLRKGRIDSFYLYSGTGELDLPPQRLILTGPNTYGVRYVRLLLDNAYGNRMQQYVGLSEVRFGVRNPDPDAAEYKQRAKIVGGHNGRLATVPPNFALKFSDVWLSHGVTDGTGGIVVDGTLILYNVTLESNVSYSWDGGSWRAGGVAVYNRGSTYMDLCDLVWDASGTSTPPGHPRHKYGFASQGSTSFIGLLARRIGLVHATGGMIYNALRDDRDSTHHFTDGQSFSMKYEEKQEALNLADDEWLDDDYSVDEDGDIKPTKAPTRAPTKAPTNTHCTDNVLNATETDVDCGGPNCYPCATGLKCLVPTDCESGFCTNLICTAAPINTSRRHLLSVDDELSRRTTERKKLRRRRRLDKRADEPEGQVHGSTGIDMHHNHPMPVPTKWQQYDANLTIDQCKFEGDTLSTRMWDALGEQSPWWCTIDPYAAIGGNSYYSRRTLRPGVSTGVMDGSEASPLGSHRDVGGGSEGMLPGGPGGSVQKWVYPQKWAEELKHNFRWDIGGHFMNSTGGRLLRLCRVVDGDSVVLCQNDALYSGREVAIRLTGVAIPEVRNCRAYASDVVEKAFSRSQPVNENMGCSDAVMKKRAELAARFIDQFIGAQVKLELLQRWSNHGENVGRVTLVSDLPKLPDNGYGLSKDYTGSSLGEELVRHGYLVRIYQSAI